MSGPDLDDVDLHVAHLGKHDSWLIAQSWLVARHDRRRAIEGGHRPASRTCPVRPSTRRWLPWHPQSSVTRRTNRTATGTTLRLARRLWSCRATGPAPGPSRRGRPRLFIRRMCRPFPWLHFFAIDASRAGGSLGSRGDVVDGAATDEPTNTAKLSRTPRHRTFFITALPQMAGFP